MLLLLIPNSLLQAEDMEERIQSATKILEQKQGSNESIPLRVRKQAKGVAIFTVTKAAIGVGGQGGEGIVVLRDKSIPFPSWTAPSAFNMGGASLGAQLGFTETRYIVILNTDAAVKRFTSAGKVDWNMTATGTAGSATTTTRTTTSHIERDEYVVYKDSSGVFGGATFGGTSVERKDEINQKAYGADVHAKDILNGKVKSPKTAHHLYELLDAKS